MFQLSHRRTRAAGFTLVELLVVIAIIALLVAILLPGLAAARCAAKQVTNQNNLNQYSTATHSYASEFQDRLWAFTWRGGVNAQTEYPDLQPGGVTNDDVAAAARQATDIFRRRAPNYEDFPLPGNWIPHILYSHLVLLDYLAARLPEPMVRSPLDRTRQRWAELDLENRPALLAEFAQGGLTTRWQYSSSYSPTMSSFTPDKETFDGGQCRSASWNTFTTTTTASYRLGNRKLGDVQFPGQKIHMYENISRVCGRGDRDAPFIYYGANVNVTTFAGATATVAMTDVNKGGYTRPNAQSANPGSAALAWIDYSMPNLAVGDPLWIGDPSFPTGPAYMRHTVGGLRGVDIGGGDVFPSPNYAGVP
ncbi:MAG: type II secretion system protein [Phycisphaerales bacterium]